MIETLVQLIGITFVCIIMICIGWTIAEYIFLKSKDKQL